MGRDGDGDGDWGSGGGEHFFTVGFYVSFVEDTYSDEYLFFCL